MDLGLAGHTYIVTGGTSGLGRAGAEALVAEGANVVVSSRDESRVTEAAAALGARVVGVAADLTDSATPGRLIAAAREAFGGVDGAFVSHGGPPAGEASQLSDERLATAVAVALIAPIRFIREVAAVLEPGGAIAVITSTSSVEPLAGLAASNVTRPGTWGYVKSLAQELGPRGIRINALLPGSFRTARLLELITPSGEPTPEEEEAWVQSIPLRRLGSAEELGRVAAFLLSPAASYITGAAIAVDGGRLHGL